MMQKRLLALSISTLFLTACGGDDNNDTQSPLQSLGIQCASVETASDNQSGLLTPQLVDTYQSGAEFASAAAEIVSYDRCSDKLYVVNAQAATVDVLSLSATDSTPTKQGSIDLSAAAAAAQVEIGAANSVSARQGLVAVAIEGANKQADGLIALYRSDTLALLGTYPAGALPDMVTLSEDGRYILTANEGEPSGDYKNDPEGSITIVDLNKGFSADKAVVRQVGFKEFNHGASRAAELPAGVRISGPAGTTVAQDLEPEYLTLSSDGATAWVALQENNALAIVDVANARVRGFAALGEKPWNAASGNQLDASNKDGAGQFSSYEQLAGLYMPDTLASISINGSTYILSANEGDGREYVYETTQQACETAGHLWDGDDFTGLAEFSTEQDDCISHLDEIEGGDLVDLTDAAHPLKAALDDNNQLKKLKFIRNGDSVAADETLHTYGARSFSIWNAAGELVYDSGDSIAKKVFELEPDHFNSDNEINGSPDDRSDNKGIEPEAIETATIGDRHFAFVGLERQGGVMVFDITTPQSPIFQSYVNNRDFSEPVCTLVNADSECDNKIYNPAAGDLGPESIEYFSRLGKHYIAIGNEVSGTTSVYQLSFAAQ